MNWLDTISVVAWASGALAGYVGGLFRIFVPFLFLVSAIALAGALGLLIGPLVFFFVEDAARQDVAGFFLVFAAMLGVGLLVTLPMWGLLSAATPLMSVFPMGRQINRIGGLLMGAFSGMALLAVVIIGLQQYPVASVGQGMAESSFATEPVHWLDRYIATIEISPE
ncbi:MAG: hypothetical protein F4X66_05990 [Chloroflexi bacterium]|nr:hypothetical protein [Chloroflexota bacterium]